MTQHVHSNQHEGVARQEDNTTASNWWSTGLNALTSIMRTGSARNERSAQLNHHSNPAHIATNARQERNQKHDPPLPISSAAKCATAVVESAPAATSPSSAPNDAIISPSSSSGDDENSESYWGISPSTPYSVDSDPALSDMLAFFMFSHRQHSSTYTGAICFQLEYPDGQKACHTVQIVSEEEVGRMARAREEEEKREAERAADAAAEAQAARSQARRRARVIPLDAVVLDQSSSASAALRGEVACLAWLPIPCVRLRLPGKGESTAPCADLVPAVETAAAAAASTPAATLPSMPCSPRVLIHSSPAPPTSIPLSATLSCTRDVFFGVYQGDLDPIQVVLKGHAHVTGYRYMELMKFGRSFELESHKWKEFYRTQREVEEEKKKILALTQGNGEAEQLASGPFLTQSINHEPAMHHPTIVNGNISAGSSSGREEEQSNPPTLHSSFLDARTRSFIRALSTSSSHLGLNRSRPLSLSSSLPALSRRRIRHLRHDVSAGVMPPAAYERLQQPLPAPPFTAPPSTLGSTSATTPSVPAPLSVIPRSSPQDGTSSSVGGRFSSSAALSFSRSSLHALLDEAYEVSKDVWTNSTCTFVMD